MKISRSHKIRLRPNNVQETYFRKACGTSRFSWNWGLAEWKKQYEAGEKPSGGDLRKSFNQIKKEQFPWVFDVLRDANSQPFANLDVAFKRFFKGTAKYPKFKKKGNRDGFYIANDQFVIDGKRIRIPRLGWVRMREALRFEGKIMSATVSRQADKWFVSINIEMKIPDPVSKNQAAVGIDFGVKALATLSTGEVIVGPKPHKVLLGRLRRLNKNLAKKQKGSNNRRKAKVKLGRLHARIANIRNDALHKFSSKVVSEFGVVGVEDLGVRGMSQNRRLARAILDMGFYEAKRQLEYKAVVVGGKVVQADRWYPSSKTCNVCGLILKELPLSVREWTCPKCKTVHDRDMNASINLEKKAVGSTVAACGPGSAGADVLANA